MGERRKRRLIDEGLTQEERGIEDARDGEVGEEGEDLEGCAVDEEEEDGEADDVPWNEDEGSDEEDEGAEEVEVDEDEDEEDVDEEDEGDEDEDDEGETAEQDDEDSMDEDDDGSDLSPEGMLDRILSRLAFAIPDGCRVDVTPRNDINGWTDGDSVTITSRAVEELPEGALAALVAHELAHVHMRHIQHRRELAEVVAHSLVGVWRESGAGLVKRIASTVAAAGVSLVAARLYSKLQELGADAGALYLLREAGYTVDDARELEQRLDGESGLLSTHPSQETRLRWLALLED